jgi:DNA-binding response OmpR family regulator
MARLLIVEDNLDDAILLSRFADALGHASHVASTVVAAQEIFERDPPDLVLLDINLGPGAAPGYVLLNAMHDNPKWRATPVVIVSVLSPDAIRAHVQGDTSDMRLMVVGKPAGMEELRAIIAAMLGGSDAPG